MTVLLAPAGLLSVPRAALADHLAAHGPLPAADAAELAGAAWLTARDGVPAAVGIRAVPRAARTAGCAPVMVADGAGGDPAALGDRALLARVPHLVLDGLVLTGRTLGADTLVLAAPPDLLPVLARAVAERGDAVRLHAVAGRSPSLQGWPAHSWADGRPTSGGAGQPALVLDPETLARLALLARGCTAAAGTLLVTRRWEAAGIPHADVVDADPGSRLADLLPLGGARAVLVGGCHGTWVPVATARRLGLGRADLAAFGVHRGTGVLAALPADRCGLLETARVLASLAGDPAARCGRCADHLDRVAAALADPAPPPAGLLDTAGPTAGPTACRHAEGAARLVAGALEVFADEVTAHRYGSCTATSWAPFLPVPPRAG